MRKRYGAYRNKINDLQSLWVCETQYLEKMIPIRVPRLLDNFVFLDRTISSHKKKTLSLFMFFYKWS
jgi:hypothetical protein